LTIGPARRAPWLPSIGEERGPLSIWTASETESGRVPLPVAATIALGY